MSNEQFVRQRPNLGGMKALDRAANENGWGLDVFVVNGNVPVRFQTTQLYVDSNFNEIRKEYFEDGVKASYVLQCVADSAGSLNGKIIWLYTPDKRYDIYLVNDSSTPADGDANGLSIIQVIVNFTTDDTASTIANLIKIELDKEGNQEVVQGKTDGSMLLVTNLRVGVTTTPDLKTSGFSVSNEEAGSSPEWVATRFQDFIQINSEWKVMKEEWVTKYDRN